MTLREMQSTATIRALRPDIASLVLISHEELSFLVLSLSICSTCQGR